VLLDKDGSAMLNPVGLVQEGRIAPDTGHSFSASKDAVPNIAVRFYMHNNFYLTDPDAFSVTKVVNLDPDQGWHRQRAGLTLSEAQVQIVLAALAGGMYEIGDDLPTLGSQPDRLELVENQEILAMNRLGRAARPLDLMTFRPEDKAPSVFFLVEDPHQAILAVFNWAESPLSHTFTLTALGLPADHPFHAFDVLNKDEAVPLNGETLEIADQPPHSVRLVKLTDDSVPAAAPQVTVQAPASATAGQSFSLSAVPAEYSVPGIFYHWDFGDGTEATGQNVAHAYTLAGNYTGKLTVKGVEGLSATTDFSVKATGTVRAQYDLSRNRRYTGEHRAESPEEAPRN
jgi:alpha-galactosidase